MCVFICSISKTWIDAEICKGVKCFYALLGGDNYSLVQLSRTFQNVSTCQMWDALIWKLLQTYQNLENALLKWFSKVTHLAWSSSRIKQSDGVLFIIFLICFIYDFLPEFRPCRLVSFLMYWKISVKNRQFPYLTNNSCSHWGWSCLIIMLIGNDTWAIKW